MTEPEELKKKNIQKPGICVALKSQNEVYYQMASILSAISYGRGESAQKIFNRYLKNQSFENYLEKFF